MKTMNHQKEFEAHYKLLQVASTLKVHDKISVIFLLCKKAYHGLNMMELVLNSSSVQIQNKLFSDWVTQQQIFSSYEWNLKFIEAITIIQNYRVGSMLGYRKKKLIDEYSPKDNFKSFSVSNIKKVLYNLCEELSSAQYKQLLQLVEKQNGVIMNSFAKGDNYLEYKLLLWCLKKIISLDDDKLIDLDVLVSCLEPFKVNKLVSDLKIVTEQANCNYLRMTKAVQNNLTGYYEIIDKNNLGFCVIINEKNFPGSDFNTRWGTGKDVERLIEVFSAFGFKVQVHTDVRYQALLHLLEDYSRMVTKCHSFFILIILSHGSENVIYTSDAVPVTMDCIEMKFQAEECPHLIGKPKIFIIQSCQGQKWQKAQIKPNKSSQLLVDSPPVPTSTAASQLIGPQKGDSVIAWSTVRGYASFRDKYNGSWYIQELCKELWRFGEVSDLVDIFTSVNNNLRSKIYDEQVMVPSLSLSLRGKIQFPVVAEIQRKGRQLMVERLIFEEYFRNFLSSQKQLFKNCEM